MDINEIRRNNLVLLQELEGTFRAIAEKADVGENYLSQVNTRKRNMGDEVARKIEVAYGQPHGWMDTLQAHVNGRRARVRTGAENTEPISRTVRRVPLISWVQAGMPEIVADPYAPGVADEWVETEAAVSRHTYCLRVRGDSMVRPDGTGFPPGTIIVVDPELEARNNNFVVVRFSNSDEATFKQLVIDGPNKLLRALNPGYPSIPVSDDARLCGVVIEKRLVERLI